MHCDPIFKCGFWIKSQSAVLSFFKPHENLYNKTPLVVIEEHVSYLNMQIDTGIVLIIWQSKGVSKYVRVCGGRLLDPQFSKSIFGLIHPCLIHIIGSLLTLLVLCAVFWRWKDRTLLKKAWTGKNLSLFLIHWWR